MSALQEIVLHGALAEKFGATHHLAVDCAAEAVRALIFTRPGFRDTLRQGSYRVLRGSLEDGLELDETMLGMRLGSKPLHIIPAPIGAGRGGAKIIIGVVMVVLAVVTAGAAAAAEGAAVGAAEGVGAAAAEGAAVGGIGSGLGGVAFAGVTYGQIAGIGASMVLSGISNLITPSPKTNAGSTPAQNASYIFSGAQNTTIEGSAIPLVYGEVLTGSVVMAASLSSSEAVGPGAINFTAANGLLYSVMTDFPPSTVDYSGHGIVPSASGIFGIIPYAPEFR